jgi:DNA-binding NarL/FixJ family response regulator
VEAEIRVVLADDHVVLREATAELIDHQADMQVVGQAGTGEEIIALTRELHPSVIVMDIAMPRLDGLAATRQIVAQCPAVRVLVLTAHEESEHVIPLLEAGATGYLPKTVGLNELLEAIRCAGRKCSSVLKPAWSGVVRVADSGSRGAELAESASDRGRSGGRQREGRETGLPSYLPAEPAVCSMLRCDWSRE